MGVRGSKGGTEFWFAQPAAGQQATPFCAPAVARDYRRRAQPWPRSALLLAATQPGAPSTMPAPPMIRIHMGTAEVDCTELFCQLQLERSRGAAEVTRRKGVTCTRQGPRMCRAKQATRRLYTQQRHTASGFHFCCDRLAAHRGSRPIVCFALLVSAGNQP